MNIWVKEHMMSAEPIAPIIIHPNVETPFRKIKHHWVESVKTYTCRRVQKTVLINDNWFTLSPIFFRFGTTMTWNSEHTVDIVIFCFIKVFFNRVAIVGDQFY